MAKRRRACSPRKPVRVTCYKRSQPGGKRKTVAVKSHCRSNPT